MFSLFFDIGNWDSVDFLDLHDCSSNSLIVDKFKFFYEICLRKFEDKLLRFSLIVELIDQTKSIWFISI